MKKMNHLRDFLFVLVALLTLPLAKLSAQIPVDPFVGWTFDQVQEPMYYYGTEYYANFGPFPFATLYADGNYGSSEFATEKLTNWPQMLKYDWLGTKLGDPRMVPVKDSYCLGFKHYKSAGRSFVISFPTSMYHNLVLRFAVTRSNTGFKTMAFAWSLDGNTYTPVAAKPCDALDWEMQEVSFQGYTNLDDQPMVYFRITIDNIASTAAQGNIKFDNICVMGSKCADTLVYTDTTYTGQPYNRYGFIYDTLSGIGDVVFSRRVLFPTTCDSVYMLNLTLLDTVTIDTVSVDTVASDTINSDTSETITTSINRWLDASINVFPNPVAEQVHISTGFGVNCTSIVVYNSVGQVVFRVDNSADMKQPDGVTIMTSKWKKGTYFVKFVTTEGTVVRKIAKI